MASQNLGTLSLIDSLQLSYDVKQDYLSISMVKHIRPLRFGVVPAEKAGVGGYLGGDQRIAWEGGRRRISPVLYR